MGCPHFLLGSSCYSGKTTWWDYPFPPLEGSLADMGAHAWGHGCPPALGLGPPQPLQLP